MVFACDSTVTPAKGAERVAMPRRSSGGTARRSKKLLALYNLRRSGNGSASVLRTPSSCAAKAPGGVGPSIVNRHKSQNVHVNGHSAPARKTVSARSTLPSGRRSSSIKEACALYGSTSGFGGRRLRIRRSVADALTPPRCAASRSGGGSGPRSGGTCARLVWPKPSRAGTGVLERPASRFPAPSESRARRSLP